MDFNNILIWTIILTCGFLIFRDLLILKIKITSWSILALCIGGLTTLGIFFIPQYTGCLGGGLFLLFILIPLLVYKEVNKLIMKMEYKKAQLVLRILSLLHPWDGWWQLPPYFAALDQAREGRVEQAIKEIQSYKNVKSSLKHMHMIQILKLADHWQEIIEYIEREFIKQRIDNTIVLVEYMRALAETGQLQKVIILLHQSINRIDRLPPMNRNFCRLFIFAFCGMIEQVKILFEGIMRFYTQEVKDFWLATAVKYSADPQPAQQMFKNLLGKNKGVNKKIITRRITSPSFTVQKLLTQQDLNLLKQIQQNMISEQQYALAGSIQGKRKTKPAIATYCIIGINLIVFIIEVFWGGAENDATLYRMGALVPLFALQNEWWRAVTAAFLHFGLVHLSMNMLALWVLGPFVEKSLGLIKYIIIYFVCGIGANIIFLLVNQQKFLTIPILVGASGCIFGLAGAIAAHYLWGWLIFKARMARRQFFLFAFIIIAEIIFGLSTPQVSLLAHLSGLIIGFLMVSSMFALSVCKKRLDSNH